MTLRLPRGLASPDRSGGFDALRYEILQETAATLARLGRRAESTLAELAAYDEARSGRARADGPRDALVSAAGEAVWHYAVQREVLGLGDTESLLRELRVPREVRLRMGVRPPAP